MSVFSEAELSYLAERRLGRLATIDPHGRPHVVPLGWSYNQVLDTIDTLTEAVGAGGEPLGAIIRIHPVQVLSWGLETTA